MQTLRSDVRFSARALRKTPAVSLIAILALTLGIGTTTAMFSIVYSAMFRGLPFDDSGRIAIVNRQSKATMGNDGLGPLTVHDYFDFKAQAHSFSELAGYYGGTVNVSGTDRAERYAGAFTTGNLFHMLRVQPILGRGFQEGEDKAGGARVAVISWRMWQDRFAGAPSVIGTSIRANGEPYTIIGVMPDGFRFPDIANIWLPLPFDPVSLKRGEGQRLSVTGRLISGVSYDQAAVESQTIGNRLAAEFKETNERTTMAVRPFMDGTLGPQPRKLLWIMLGAVFLVLMIACANVANLLLDRAAHRTKEVAVRSALGATRWAVIRQFLVEALLLSSTAALLGLGVAQIGIMMFNRAIANTQPPFWLDFRLHPPVLAFTAVVAIIASLVSGTIPAFQSSRSDLNEILKDDSRGASSFRIGKMSRVIVVFEIALSCGLLVAAGLMIKSVANLRTVTWGFETRNVFTARIGFPAQYTDTLAQQRMYEQLIPKLGELPGVQAATLTSSMPGLNTNGSRVAVEGVTYENDDNYPNVVTSDASPGFFQTFGIAVRQGRLLMNEDRAGALPVAVVNEEFVKVVLKGESPLGRRIRLGTSRSTDAWRTVVGVVPNTRGTDNESPYHPHVFMPLAQHHANFVNIVVRTNANTNAMSITQKVREAVASLNPDIPIYNVYSMTEALARPTWFVVVFGTIFMVFGAVALLLASVGLYAVMAFSVSRRTRELGIRMALGASSTNVIRMIFGRGVLQLGVGMTFGLALALGLAQLMQFVLFDVKARDPVIFGGVFVVLMLSGFAACLIPAMRATRVDPLVALRKE